MEKQRSGHMVRVREVTSGICALVVESYKVLNANKLDLEEGELLTVIEVSGTRLWEGRQKLGVHKIRAGLVPKSCVSTKVACVVKDNTLGASSEHLPVKKGEHVFIINEGKDNLHNSIGRNRQGKRVSY